MPTFSPEFLVQLLVMLASGGAIYGGIRSDLKAMHERIRANENSIEEARKRMDNHLDRRDRNG